MTPKGGVGIGQLSSGTYHLLSHGRSAGPSDDRFVEFLQYIRVSDAEVRKDFIKRSVPVLDTKLRR
jgi:hypothetical protein